jgi:hypothetical protein
MFLPGRDKQHALQKSTTLEPQWFFRGTHT